jgi:hypothetical protein
MGEYQKGGHMTRGKKILRGILILTVGFYLQFFCVLLGYSMTYTYRALIDVDNNASTGGQVSIVQKGELPHWEQGIDYIVRVLFDDTTGLLHDIVIDRYNPGLGAFETIQTDSSFYPKGRGNGFEGSDVVEFKALKSLLGNPPGTMKIIYHASIVGGNDYTAAFFYNITRVAVPILNTWGIFGAFLLLGGAGIYLLSKRIPLRALSVVLMLMFGMGVAWAATIVLDGQVTDWAGIAPLVTDPIGDSSNDDRNEDIRAGYMTSDSENFYFRMDVVGGRTVTTTFNVNVPGSTDGTGLSVFIAGSFSRLGGGLPDWNPGAVTLTRVDATHWTITLTGPENIHIEYNYTLGDWDHVELDGVCAQVLNRQLTLTFGATGTQTVNDTVLNWRSMLPCGDSPANMVIGTQTGDILRDPTRLHESPMGNLVADAMRLKYSDAEAALMNSGGLRANLLCNPPAYGELPCQITYGEIFAVLPFGNLAVIETLTGSQLQTAFLNGLSPACNPLISTGRFPQISGLKVQFHCTGTTPVIDGMWKAPDGPSGPLTAIGAADTIRLVTIDFLFGGGDGYSILGSGTAVVNTPDTVLEISVDYITGHSPVNPVVDGRIFGP